MALDKKLFKKDAAAASADTTTEDLILHLDAADIDSFDTNGADDSTWYDIANFEYEPTEDPADHFNIVTYSGTAGAGSITGVGFQPDMVWIKSRNLSNNHVLIDSLRGLNGGSTYENLYPNLNNAQANDNAVSSLDSDGFSL